MKKYHLPALSLIFLIFAVNRSWAPVELLSFDAEISSGFVNVSWVTASELNSKSFIIEKANVIENEEAVFKTIDTVAAAGKSSTNKEYSYEDNDVELFKTYAYRLKMIDMDGEFYYSNERAIYYQTFRVDLEWMDVQVQENTAKVSWNTSYETAVKAFVLEKRVLNNQNTDRDFKINIVPTGGRDIDRDYIILDDNLIPGDIIEYSLYIRPSWNLKDSLFSKVQINFSGTGVEQKESLSEPLGIYCYPNPFSQSATINYELAIPAHVVLNLYDVQGNEVAELVNEYQAAGTHSSFFNAAGQTEGMYYYIIRIGDKARSGKMMLVR